MWLFDKYSKWEVLETFSCNGTHYCVHARMNIRTGLITFKTTRITSYFLSCPSYFTTKGIISLFENSMQNIRQEKQDNK